MINFSLILLLLPVILSLPSSPCGPNCWECNAIDNCNNCNYGFYLTSNYTCSSCSPHCL